MPTDILLLTAQHNEFVKKRAKVVCSFRLKKCFCKKVRFF